MEKAECLKSVREREEPASRLIFISGCRRGGRVERMREVEEAMRQTGVLWRPRRRKRGEKDDEEAGGHERKMHKCDEVTVDRKQQNR